MGTWDLVKTWSGRSDEQVEARLALQLVHEAALCVKGVRLKRTLSQKGFELANGLPFVATDTAVHYLLNERSVADAKQLQIAMGKIRRTFKHFEGKILAIDPHRIKSNSKRQMVRRRKDKDSRPTKMAQTFFCLDAETQQPLCFTTGSSSKTVTQATEELLTMVTEILGASDEVALVVADNEHYTVELLDWVKADSPFDILLPMPCNSAVRRSISQVAEQAFTRHWSGYATAKSSYEMRGSRNGAYRQLIQRTGEEPRDYEYKAFLCTNDRDELEDLTKSYPKRWHIEEFFNNYQALGWDRAGTMNLNVQYGKMTMAHIAQAAISMLRQRLGEPIAQWDARHFAKDFLGALEGDIRVKGDTILVTYYNVPNSDLMKELYQNLPQRLVAEGVDPVIPWLYNFRLDFRFK